MKSLLQHSSQHFNKVAFYIIAHADDWQLFMQPNLYKDLVSPGCKVIIIIVTAGDSGRSAIFWQAREEGSRSSLRYALAPLGDIAEFDGTKKFNAHSIAYSIINNATSYFLRLPDGNIDGCGFPVHGFQSLARLRGNDIDTIMAVDGSSVYNSWTDLTVTLETILFHESEALNCSCVNYPNPDRVKNNGDHMDHLLVGEAVQNISILLKSAHYLFTGYSVGAGIERLQSAELFWKIGMFAVYEKTVYDICGYSTLAEDPHIYENWCAATADFELLRPALR